MGKARHAQEVYHGGRYALIILFGFTLHMMPALAASPTVSVRSEAAYSAMRGCARTCIGSALMSKFDCAWPYYNECMCRTDLAKMATSHFSSCCSSICTGPAEVDISGANQLYYSYCGANGYAVEAAAVAADADPTTTMVLGSGW